MKKTNYNFVTLNGVYSGLFILIVLIVGLLYVFLISNPYKNLHTQIFEIAGKTRTYYRDMPGFWHLSSDSAKENKLTDTAFTKYEQEYDIKIGQGSNGDMSLPSDMTFNIVVNHLNRTGCIALVEANLTKEEMLILNQIEIKNETNNQQFSWGRENSLPIKKHATKNICVPRENTVIFTFQK